MILALRFRLMTPQPYAPALILPVFIKGSVLSGREDLKFFGPAGAATDFFSTPSPGPKLALI